MDVKVFMAIASALAVVSVGAILKAIQIFLRHIAKSEERQDAQQTRQEAFLSNHLSGLTRSIEASTRAQERVADRLERVEQKVIPAPQVVVKDASEVKVGS